MTAATRTVSLDQHHWVGLAKVLKGRGADPTYQAIFELGAALQSAGLVRFPLSTDRYHETLRCSPHHRIDLASAMAALSGYETLLQLDTLTLVEIDESLCSIDPSVPSPEQVPVFGEGCLHAFGRRSLADSLTIDRPVGDDGLSAERLAFLTEQTRAVVREMWARHYEWTVLSGDPRTRPLDPSLRARYDAARADFACEEQRRLEFVHEHGWEPRKAGYFYALRLHLDQIIERAIEHGVDLTLAPLDTDPVSFIESIPTIHVLAELLSHQYWNPQTSWTETDWADMRTLCVALPYCDAVAPDKKWAAAVAASGLDTRYHTQVLRNASDLLHYLNGLQP